MSIKNYVGTLPDGNRILFIDHGLEDSRRKELDSIFEPRSTAQREGKIDYEEYNANNYFSIRLEETLHQLPFPLLDREDPINNLLILQEHIFKAIRLSRLSPPSDMPLSLCYRLLDEYYLLPMAKENCDPNQCIELIRDLCLKLGQKRRVEKWLVNGFKMHNYNLTSEFGSKNIYYLDSEGNLLLNTTSLGLVFKETGYICDGRKNLWKLTNGMYELVSDKELGKELATKIRPEFVGRNKISSMIWMIKSICFDSSFYLDDNQKILLKENNPRNFVADLFDVCEDGGYPVTLCYELYKHYCSLIGTCPYNISDFRKAMLGIEGISKRSFNHDHCICYAGIVLSPEKIKTFKKNGSVFPQYLIIFHLRKNRKRCKNG